MSRSLGRLILRARNVQFSWSPSGPRRHFVASVRENQKCETSRPTRHLFSRDTVSAAENVRLDEALMGVARNPLRERRSTDGNHLRAPSCMLDAGTVHSRMTPRSPRRASSCIGSAMHDLGRGAPRSPFNCRPFRSALERAADFGVRQGDAVHPQRRCDRTTFGFSSRGTRATKLSPSRLEASQGLCRPLRARSTAI